MCSRVFLFFKQKTAYELRISDWSSDGCSSDLLPVGHPLVRRRLGLFPDLHPRGHDRGAALRGGQAGAPGDPRGPRPRRLRAPHGLAGRAGPRPGLRSEEHTSELQSLMRTSYAVFCLKKKTKKKISRHDNNKESSYLSRAQIRT